MRGGSSAAETDHVWAAAAHISPSRKVARPPMINSTGEQNGGSRSLPESRVVTLRRRPVWSSVYVSLVRSGTGPINGPGNDGIPRTARPDRAGLRRFASPSNRRDAGYF